MKVQIESSRSIKPCYEGGSPPPIPTYTPLSVFDEVTYVVHVSLIYGYKPPTLSNATLEQGLQKVLAIYREWAGRLRVNDYGIYSIFLNDEGVKFIEASGEGKLDKIMPLEPFRASELGLFPSTRRIDELLQVQLTRFTCGSLVVGVTAHHHVCDGEARTKFLVAWGQACRGLIINPLPLQHRTIFAPRKPPSIEFEHRGVEFSREKPNHPLPVDKIIMHKAHFTADFLLKLRAEASSLTSENKPSTTFESLLAHLWRSITLARHLGLEDTTHASISVNGRTRFSPRVPNEYFGNVVLRAFPKSQVKDLLDEPLSYAAKLIHEAVTKIDNNYFKSFIDFASNEAKREGLDSTFDVTKQVLCPNVEVHSWLRFPFHEIDFGGGSPFIFMPSEIEVEGFIILAPTLLKDGSIDAYVSLYKENMAAFKCICYSLV